MLLNLSRERMFLTLNVIGPFLALATALLMLFYPSALLLFFAVTMIAGLPLSWYLKKWGIVLSATILTLLLFFYAKTMANDQVWHIGVALSIILTLFIAHKSYEEALLMMEEMGDSSNASQKIKEQHQLDLDRLGSHHHKDLLDLQINLENLKQELKETRKQGELFQESVEKSKNDVQLAKNEALQAKNQLEAARNELQAKSLKEEHVLDELLEKRKEIFQLRDQLIEAQEELKNRSIENNTLSDESELRHLQDVINKKEQDLFNLQFRLDSALEDIQEQEKKLSKIQEEEIQLKTLNHAMSEKIDTLKTENEFLGLTIHKLKNETEKLQALENEKIKLEQALNTACQELEITRLNALKDVEKEISTPIHESQGENVNQEYSLRRRAEGMYIQLKEQFNNKSNILDETRRQLFHAQESLMALQRDVKECEQFRNDPHMQNLINHILKMQQHTDHREKSHKSEIEHLEGIIEKLSQR